VAPPPRRVVQAYYSDRGIPVALARAQALLPKQPPHAARAFLSRSSPPLPARQGARRAARSGIAGTAQLAVDLAAFKPPPGFLEKASSSKGQGLPVPVRKKMEAFFGADFSDVRVRVGPEAAAIGAIAFTVGSDLYFAPGQYDPNSRRGQELLGHELAHVVQQREGRVANPYGDGVAVVQDPSLEDEADRLGKAAATGELRLARAIQPKSGYRLILGAYMHPSEGRAMPDPLAGHTFVALERPDGVRDAWGFSPAGFGSYDLRQDMGRLYAGVDGVVHDDVAALDKPGVRTRAYAVDEAQARAALGKVAEYRSGKHRFSLGQRQCATFAVDVLRAARVKIPAEKRVWMPQEMYDELAGD
jgi:hypothetical protein